MPSWSERVDQSGMFELEKLSYIDPLNCQLLFASRRDVHIPEDLKPTLILFETFFFFLVW
jgi:hypothetical protein